MFADGSVVSPPAASSVQRNATCVTVGPGVSQFYLGCEDGTVETPEDLNLTPSEPGSPVTAVVVDGTNPRLLIAGHHNGLIDIFDASGEFLDSIQAHSSPVTALAVSGRKIVSGSRNGSIKTWPLLRLDYPSVRRKLAASRNPAIARLAIRHQQPASIFFEVAGTGAHELNERSLAASEAVGAALARASFGLITGAWPGVDYVAARAYLRAGGKSLVQVLSRYSVDRFEEALLVDALDEEAAERLADAVVLIGGLGGTFRVFESARKMGKPVFPYGPSGGDAEKCAAILGERKRGILQASLSPQEFSDYIVNRMTSGKLSEHLDQMWELAAQYDNVRREMQSSSARTSLMGQLFRQMLSHAGPVSERLPEFQASASAGRRLAAVAILCNGPRRDQLEWLAGRLDNPEAEKPFVGFQAARALYAAVAALDDSDCGRARTSSRPGLASRG